MHFNGLKLLCQKKMVHGLPFISCVDDVCKGCVYESNINSHFRLEKLGEPSNLLSWCMHIFVVRWTLCLWIRVDISYCLLMILLTWVWFFPYSEVRGIWKISEIKAFAENKCGHEIKILRTDGGGEFLYNDFEAFYRKHGTRRQLTVRKLPEQNDIAERKNQTVVEMARSMPSENRLSNEFWAEVVGYLCSAS